MADSTLNAIRTKARRLTRSPSTSQITNAQLDEYINTFILYDLPEQLRLFSLRSSLTFYTQPYVDKYSTDVVDPLNPLFNFKNKYIAIHPPVFIAGIQSFYTQKREEFYGLYPQTNSIVDTALRGNGGVGPFVGTLFAHPMIRNSVIFTCLDQIGNSMILVDYPVTNLIGSLGIPNQVPLVFPSPYGQINYVTGAFTVTFPAATVIGGILYGENIAYQPGKPTTMLFYENSFTIRPVPDKTYAIQLDVDMRPTELLTVVDIPLLEQWWQYIAYGAAKKIFEDKMDIESIQMIMPEYKNQEVLTLRSTLTQRAEERTKTIYTQGKMYGLPTLGGGWPY
jgi:hypothetical protein